MILVWSLGDLCNLVGVCLTGAMPTQFMMAILFCTCDGILNFQNIYYKYWCPQRSLHTQQQYEQQQQAEAREIQSLLESTDSHESALETPSGSGSDPDSPPLKPPAPDISGKQGTSPAHKLHSLSAGLMLLGCGMVTTGVPLVLTAGVTGAIPGGSNYYSSGSQSGLQDIGLGRVLLSEGGAAAPHSGKLSVMFGSLLGWIMTCSYVGSRIPQLVKNYRRGMTTGLSLPMFVLLVLGSTTYVASIFVRSTKRDFVVPKLPWLLEAMGSAVLDFSIVCQVLYFRKKNKHQPEAAALLPGAGLAQI
ncbi:TPA: PQ loop repeat-containing protein 2, variant 2 [Trebouxia sp. C0005]